MKVELTSTEVESLINLLSASPALASVQDKLRAAVAAEGVYTCYEPKLANTKAKWEGVACTTCRHTANLHAAGIGVCVAVNCPCDKLT